MVIDELKQWLTAINQVWLVFTFTIIIMKQIYVLHNNCRKAMYCTKIVPGTALENYFPRFALLSNYATTPP